MMGFGPNVVFRFGRCQRRPGGPEARRPGGPFSYRAFVFASISADAMIPRSM